MSRLAFPLLALALVCIPCGCTTPAGGPPPDLYAPPAPAAQNAFLKGMRITESGMFGSDHTGFVAGVDQWKVAEPDEGWDKPLPLTPGKHTIGVEYRYSNFHARAELTLLARPGVTYQLMIKPGREYQPDGPLFVEFWIEDTSTGQPVTQVQHRELLGGKKGTIFYMNK